MCFEIAMTS